MKRLLFLALLAVSLPAMAARMSITSYGVPHSYALDPSDAVTFDTSGLLLTVTSVDAKGTLSHRQFYLGYSNKVAFDTVGGALKNLVINTSDSGAKSVPIALIDSITFTPSVDSSGDDDGDGLTNYQEVMIYHTDPRKKDTDGDGIDDYTETTWDPKVYSPLVANLPSLKVTMTQSPQILLNASTSSSTSQSIEAAKGQSWGSDNGVSTSHSVLNSEQIATGTTLGQTTDVEAGFFTSGAKFESSWEWRFDITQQHEVTNEWSSDQRVNYSKTLDSTTTVGSETGTTINNATISVPITIANSGTIGVTLTSAEYTLYGTSYYNGQPYETPLITLAPLSAASGSSITSLDVGKSSGEMILKGDITLAQAKALENVVQFTVRRTAGTISYTIQPPTSSGSAVSLTSSDVSTSVNATTARIEVDFDNALSGQETPMVRQVAVLNKPSASGYAPAYLGELLTAMGLTYSFDDTGFIEVNGLKRTKTSNWVAIKMTSHRGGQGYDTAALSFKRHAGPDSVVVGAGDYVLLGYSGDDDSDGVPNLTEKFYGTYDKHTRDYDGDGISDSAEIYGHQIHNCSDSIITVFTNPKLKDTDGDGISDSADCDPLVPRQASHANVRGVVLTDEKGVQDSVVFGSTTLIKTATRQFGAALKVAVVLDSMPRWCKAVINHGDTLLLSRDATNSNVLAFAYSDTAARFLLGADTLKIITRSLDGTSTNTWTVLGTSSLATANGLAGTIQRSTSQSWRQVDLSLGLGSQMVVDPRATGVLVMRALATAVSAAPKIDSGLVLVPNGSLGISSPWTVLEAVPVINGVETISDSFVPKGGRSYVYALVPFARQAGNYYYSPSGVLTNSIKVQRLQARAILDSMTYISGRHDGGNNAADMSVRLAYAGSALDTQIAVDTVQHWPCTGRNSLKFWDLSKFQWVDIGVDSLLKTTFQIWEDNDGDGNSYSSSKDVAQLLSSDWFAADSGFSYKNLSAAMSTAVAGGNTSTLLSHTNLADQTVSGVDFHYATHLELRLVD